MRIRQLADCQLADWTTRGLADAAKKTKAKHAKSPVASESCLVRELTSPRDVQAASRPVHELSICELSSNRSEWAPLYASGYPLKCIVPLFPFGTRKLHSSPMHFPCRPVNYTLAYTECTGLALCIDTSSTVAVNINL